MNSTISRRLFGLAVAGFLLAGTFAVTPRPASAAVDSFIWFTVETGHGQIKGPSTTHGREGWFQVDRASLGNLDLTEENHAAIMRGTSGAGAGKVRLNEFTIHKSVDSASPLLFQAAQRSEPVRTVVVECVSGNHITHRLTITGGTMTVRSEGPGKEAITFAGGNIAYN